MKKLAVFLMLVLLLLVGCTTNDDPNIENISKERAEEIGLEQCKTNYDYIETKFDNDKQQWSIEFWENNAKLPAQTIWVDTEGNVVNIWWAE